MTATAVARYTKKTYLKRVQMLPIHAPTNAAMMNPAGSTARYSHFSHLSRSSISSIFFIIIIPLALYYPCIPQHVGGIAEPLAVPCLVINLLSTYLALLDQTHEPGVTADQTLRLSHPKGLTVHQSVDHLQPCLCLIILQHTPVSPSLPSCTVSCPRHDP